jgi:DNA-binding SARP family transcriptional activator
MEKSWQAADKMLEIRFLSEDKLILNGKVLDQKVSSKALAVIAMLILKQNHVLPKREIITALWPESSEEAAKYNLRFNLWQLKKALDEEGGEGFLENERTSIRIGAGCEYFCDVEEILSCEPEKIEDAEKLSRLAELFREEFFVDEYFTGCSEFNDMIIMKRYNLENMRLRILKRYLELSENIGNPEYLLGRIEEALGIDPYDEWLTKLKLQNLIALGQKREAMGYYNSFRMKLLADIGKEPGKELSKLAGTIPKEAAVSGKRLNLCIFPIKDVEYFWMAEILRALLDEKSPDFRHQLSEDERQTLASVSARLGNADNRSSDARVTDTFLRVLERLIKDGYVIVLSDQSEEKASGTFAAFLKLAELRFGDSFYYSQLPKK